MSVQTHADAEGLSYLTEGTNSNVDEATQKQETPRASRQELRGHKDNVRKQFYDSERLSSIDSERRTDLRALDEHCSWREVAFSCHVEPGR